MSKCDLGDGLFDHDIMLLSARHSPDLMISSLGPALFPHLQVLKRPDRADPAVDLAGLTGRFFAHYRNGADTLEKTDLTADVGAGPGNIAFQTAIGIASAPVRGINGLGKKKQSAHPANSWGKEIAFIESGPALGFS